MAEHQNGGTPGREAPEVLAAIEAEPVAVVAPFRRSEADAAALVARLFDEHQRELYSFAFHATRDAALAEDVTQEAFARVLRMIRAGTIPDDPRAWLYRVAGNLVISRGRRDSVAIRHRQAIASLDVDDRSPERIALRRERRNAVEDALGTLAPDARTALLLAANGFSGTEIAVAIGRSEPATRTLMCRARATLRERLAEHGA